MVRHLGVDRVLRLERERVEIDPPVRAMRLQDADAVVVHQPEPPAELVELGPRFDRHRAQDPAAAEPDVREPALSVRLDQQRHVRSSGHAPRAEADPRAQTRDVEPDGLERGGEQRVVLEAVAAAAIADELVLQAREVEPDRAPEQDVEVLERDRRRVREMDRVQHLERRLDRPVVADACEVRVQVEVHRSGPVTARKRTLGSGYSRSACGLDIRTSGSSQSTPSTSM